MSEKQEDRLLDLYKKHAYLSHDAENDPLTPFGNFAKGFEVAKKESEAEISEYDLINSKMSNILTATANALKGNPDALSLHSWHDLAEVALAQQRYISLLTDALIESKRELLDVLNSINQEKVHHDGDNFHETLNKIEKVLTHA